MKYGKGLREQLDFMPSSHFTEQAEDYGCVCHVRDTRHGAEHHFAALCFAEAVLVPSPFG